MKFEINEKKIAFLGELCFELYYSLDELFFDQIGYEIGATYNSYDVAPILLPISSNE